MTFVIRAPLLRSWCFPLIVRVMTDARRATAGRTELDWVHRGEVQKVMTITGRPRAGRPVTGGVVGLLQTSAEEYLQGAGTTEGGLDAAAIEALITARREARARRDWVEADRIRDELAHNGVVLEDGAGGTVWRRA